MVESMSVNEFRKGMVEVGVLEAMEVQKHELYGKIWSKIDKIYSPLMLGTL